MSENTPPSTPTPPSAPDPYGQPPAGYSPQPFAPTVVPMLESEARTWAMLVHIIAAAAIVLSAGTLAFVAPLVVWLLYRERSALVDYHGKQNLNLQLTLLVVGVSAIVIGLVTFGVAFLITLPALFAYGVYALVISIIAGVKANAGEYYPIGFTIRFIR
ncbi:DUF4870 domain-containing protein [Demequina aestuarii]|uniref:DUF4870 domain-containing protein n=1 Tax=Demequina aestuarii TaxID=327095 RepID=UPI00078098A0|nr:DUF4870 domain-containing protein [Demequina aestuarii]